MPIKFYFQFFNIPAPLLLTLLGCLTLLLPVPAKHSDQVSLFYGLAQGSYLAGDLGGAATSIQQILRIHPDHLPALTLDARVKLDRGEGLAALASVKHALTLDPGNWELHLLKALTLGHLGRDHDFTEQIDFILENTTPDDSHHQTAKQLREVSAKAADSARVRQTLADVEAQPGQIAEAIRELQQVLGADPEHLEARILLAALYVTQQRWDSLHGILDPIKAHPEMKDIALYLEGRVALGRRRAGTARSKFAAALEYLEGKPSSLSASLHFYHGISLEKLQRPAEAEAAILRALEGGFQPETAENALMAAQVCLRAGRPEQAIPLLEVLALDEMATSAKVWSMLGRAQQANGATSLALSAFNESLRLQPRSADTLALRGSLLRKIGDLVGAAADYHSAQRLAPENGALDYARALVLLEMGNIPAAADSLRLAAEKLPDHRGIQLLLALLAEAMDQLPEAKEALRRYFSQLPEPSNETAYVLQYLLELETSPESALAQLRQRAEAASSSAAIGYFYGYCSGRLERKTVIDQAGIANNPETARRRIAEACYRMARHEARSGEQKAATELLEICLEMALPDQMEHPLAAWLLTQNNHPDEP